MADGIFPSQVSKDRNDNLVTNPIFVQLSDGTNAEGDVNVLDVIPGTGATNLGKAEDAVHTSGDVGVLALVVRQDSQVDFGADNDYVPMSVTADGELRVTAGTGPHIIVDDSAFTIATDSVSVSGYLADETAPDSVDEGDVGAARMTLDRKQLFILVDATTDANRLAIDGSGLAQVDVAAHALTNANALPVSKDNAANTELNPIFVHNVDTVISGEEVHDFDTAAAVASDTSDNHDYTAVGTFLLKSVILAGSGNIKGELINDATGTPATIAVMFLNGKEGDTQQIFLDPPLEVATADIIRLTRTNRQGAATDIYSTFIGNDV